MPRDAITDPVGREEVVQFLASFPTVPVDDFSSMSADRLGRLLGL